MMVSFWGECQFWGSRSGCWIGTGWQHSHTIWPLWKGSARIRTWSCVVQYRMDLATRLRTCTVRRDKDWRRHLNVVWVWRIKGTTCNFLQ